MKKVILSVVATALIGVAHGAAFGSADDHGTVALPSTDCLPGTVCDPINLGWQDKPVS